MNEDPYGEGWLSASGSPTPRSADDLLDAAAYQALVAEQ